MKDHEIYAVEQELKWREWAQINLPTNANERRLNYLRERYKQLKEEERLS